MNNDHTSYMLARRGLLAGLGTAAVGVAFVNDVVGDERNPATQVTDRSSSIRITGVKTYWVGPVVYVKIETNHGISGWGDLKGVDPRPAGVLAQSLVGGYFASYRVISRREPKLSTKGRGTMSAKDETTNFWEQPGPAAAYYELVCKGVLVHRFFSAMVLHVTG